MVIYRVFDIISKNAVNEIILNELNTKKFSHFSDCVEKLDIKCGGGGGAEKIRRRLNRSVDDFDSTEIRLGKTTKFDDAGV